MRLLGEIETFFRWLFNKPHDNVILTIDNVSNWPNFKKLFDEGKIIADGTGRLRYPHGAPVGRMTILRRGAQGMPVYKEAADEWFDPDSSKAQNFEWP